jgi:ComF family protein
MSNFRARGAGQLLKKWAAIGGQDCALCGARSDAEVICAECERRLPACGDERMDTGVRIVAVFAYRFPVDRLMHRFKFAGDLAVGRWLASRLAQHVARADRPELLVAPPLTPARLRERGFNQALEVAKAVGRAHGIRVLPDALEKMRETQPQPALRARERRTNLRGAFECRQALCGASVAIVDDVVTTGGTVHAIAEALRAAGAGRIDAWSVARTPAPGRP